MLCNKIGSGVAFRSQIKHICTEIYNLSDKVRFKKNSSKNGFISDFVTKTLATHLQKITIILQVFWFCICELKIVDERD